MDVFEELERLAFNAVQVPEIGNIITPEEISRWERLFGYNQQEATDLIEQHNQDFTRNRISDEHWEMIRSEREPQGYDRKAYEHELAIGGRRKSPTQTTTTHISATEARKTFLLKLEGPLNTSDAVKIAASLAEIPETVTGEGDDGETTFCCVNGIAKQSILNWLVSNAPSFTPTFARLTQKSYKELSPTSLHPTLGIDSTLPQFRLDSAKDIAHFEPAQDQHPIWYFFYGTLAQPEILSRQIGVAEEDIVLRAATVSNGQIKMWGEKYKALVDAPAGAIVQGFAYQIMTNEQEDALRVYETDNYEVVRCSIFVDSEDGEKEEIKGCTFRFVGEVDK